MALLFVAGGVLHAGYLYEHSAVSGWFMALWLFPVTLFTPLAVAFCFIPLWRPHPLFWMALIFAVTFGLELVALDAARGVARRGFIAELQYSAVRVPASVIARYTWRSRSYTVYAYAVDGRVYEGEVQDDLDQGIFVVVPERQPQKSVPDFWLRNQGEHALAERLGVPEEDGD